MKLPVLLKVMVMTELDKPTNMDDNSQSFMHFVLCGAIASGKTTFLSALFNAVPNIGVNDQATMVYLRRQHDLLLSGKTVEKTPAGMMVHLTFNYAHPEDGHIATVGLDDYPGELVENLMGKIGRSDEAERLMNRIKTCRGIIFLFPFETAPIPERMKNFQAEIDTVIKLIRSAQPDTGTGGLSIPAVIAVTKWDLSPNYRSLDENQKAIDYIAAVPEFNEALQQIKTFFREVTIIPMSALGSSSERVDGRLKPYNLVEPFAWFLNHTYEAWLAQSHDLRKDGDIERATEWLADKADDIRRSGKTQLNRFVAETQARKVALKRTRIIRVCSATAFAGMLLYGGVANLLGGAETADFDRIQAMQRSLKDTELPTELRLRCADFLTQHSPSSITDTVFLWWRDHRPYRVTVEELAARLDTIALSILSTRLAGLKKSYEDNSLLAFDTDYLNKVTTLVSKAAPYKTLPINEDLHAFESSLKALAGWRDAVPGIIKDARAERVLEKPDLTKLVGYLSKLEAYSGIQLPGLSEEIEAVRIVIKRIAKERTDAEISRVVRNTIEVPVNAETDVRKIHAIMRSAWQPEFGEDWRQKANLIIQKRYETIDSENLDLVEDKVSSKDDAEKLQGVIALARSIASEEIPEIGFRYRRLETLQTRLVKYEAEYAAYEKVMAEGVHINHVRLTNHDGSCDIQLRMSTARGNRVLDYRDKEASSCLDYSIQWSVNYGIVPGDAIRFELVKPHTVGNYNVKWVPWPTLYSGQVNVSAQDILSLRNNKVWSPKLPGTQTLEVELSMQ